MMNGRLQVARYTVPPSTAMLVSIATESPGAEDERKPQLAVPSNALRESLSWPLCSPTGVFQISAPVVAFIS